MVDVLDYELVISGERRVDDEHGNIHLINLKLLISGIS